MEALIKEMKSGFLMTAPMLFLILLLAGCGGGDNAQNSGGPNVTISLSIPGDSDAGAAKRLSKYTHQPINSIKLEVPLSNYTTQIDIINISGGTYTNTYTVEPGTYTFKATAFDNATTATYYGETIHTVAAGSAISIQMVAIDEVQAAVDGVNKSFAKLKDLFNSGTVTAAAVLPFHHASYLDGGWNRDMSALDMVYFSSQETITTLYVQNAPPDPGTSYDSNNKRIRLDGFYESTQSGVTESEIFAETFQKDPATGNWLLYGDQQIAETTLLFGLNRIYDGTTPFTQNNYDHYHIGAPEQANVTQVIVSAPFLTQNVTFTPSGTRNEVSGIVEVEFSPPAQFDTYFVTSPPPQVSDVITYDVTGTNIVTGASGTFTYTQTLKTVNFTDAPFIDSFFTNDISEANLGSPLTVNFTIPPALAGGEIDLEGSICDFNFTACEHIDGDITGPGVGTITLPLTLSDGTETIDAQISVDVHLGEEIHAEAIYLFRTPM